MNNGYKLERMKMEVNKIYQGDCLEELKKLPDSSVDAIVTDPPYELGFMGKSWDSTGIANNVDMWKECLRVLKSGGHLLSFGGTRTYHRMASAIEDAGFEIRDMIEWVYGSGFPKSLNIGKAVDKLQGNERSVVGHSPYEGRRPNKFGGKENGDICYGDYKAQPEMLVDKGTSEWEGWGTALKPSHEPICMARKPLAEKTVAENCLKYGTGGINIDESRVGTDKIMINGGGGGKGTGWGKKEEINEERTGRFPANLIHDGSDEVVGLFPNTKKMVKEMTGEDIEDVLGNGYEEYECNDTGAGWFEKGGRGKRQKYTDNNTNASRFFKSIKKDLHCSLCYDTIEESNITKNICKHTNVNNVEKSSKNTQGTKESIAQKNATGNLKENLVQNVKSAGNLCDLCGTYIAQRLAEQKKVPSQELTLGKVFISEPKKQILDKCLASFVELRGNTDTTPTMENLNLLFGYVLNAIDNYTQKCEEENEKDSNHTQRSLLYYPKASKSERNKGCDELPIKSAGGLQGRADGSLGGEPVTAHNNHPTVKPIALMEYLIKMITPKGGIVLDPFAGSGSTLVAAKNLGRNYIGIELEPEYVKIAEARLNAVQERLIL